MVEKNKEVIKFTEEQVEADWQRYYSKTEDQSCQEQTSDMIKKKKARPNKINKASLESGRKENLLKTFFSPKCLLI